ncbi:MAG: RNA methyltransferase substrate-binding domain-containing protein, partial [Ruthenibacterium sp.]
MEDTQRNQMEDTTLAYGKNAVTELLKSGVGVDTVFIQDTMNAAQAGFYTALAKEVGAVVKRVHATKLRGMCGTESHQGVAANAAGNEYAELDDLLA